MNDHDLIIRIDENVEQIKERLSRGDRILKHHDHRISKIERWKAAIAGGLATIAILVGIIFEMEGLI